MKRFFGSVFENKAIIEGDEFLHLKTVLRMKEGESVVVFDGTEKEYVCEISEIKKDRAFCVVKETNVCKALPKKNIVLYQALTKREKLELIVQKAVELGVSEIVPFDSQFCTAKDSITKKDRLEKIVLGACKQCEMSVPTKISKTLSFDEMLRCASKHDIVLFAHERAGESFDYSCLKSFKNIAIIVGPEGGFSAEERQKIEDGGAKAITLGKRILRSETATIVLCGIVSVMSEN